MISEISLYFILMEFYIFSFAGWIYECFFVFLRDRKLVNRGFLVGPILPLYGFGGVLVYLILKPFADIPSLLYIMGMIVATLIEYITSWLLEILFHTKWWDYSGQQYNFQGKIAVIPSLFWGLLSLLLFDVFHPVAAFLIESVSEETGRILLMVFMGLTAVDVIYTLITLINFRKQLENLYEFRKELEYLLEDMKLLSLKEILSSTTKDLSGHFQWSGLSGRKDLFFQKLNSIRNSEGEGDSKFSAIEERFRVYWEKCRSFIRKSPLIGNQRLLDAFPSMKIITKNRSAVDVKELLLNSSRKKGSEEKKSAGEQEGEQKNQKGA